MSQSLDKACSIHTRPLQLIGQHYNGRKLPALAIPSAQLLQPKSSATRTATAYKLAVSAAAHVNLLSHVQHTRLLASAEAKASCSCKCCLPVLTVLRCLEQRAACASLVHKQQCKTLHSDQVYHAALFATTMPHVVAFKIFKLHAWHCHRLLHRSKVHSNPSGAHQHTAGYLH